MRTSSSQFRLMVDFMERHGDLSRPSDGPRGRVANIKRWEELVSLLNADASGDTKKDEKWKKTWSDLKNNTKRKAAKISKAVSGTGGSASRLQLTDIEERVLAIMNPQAATGKTGVSEVGVEQEDKIIELKVEILEDPENENDWIIPDTSSQSTASPPPPPPPQSQLLTRSPVTPPTVPRRRQRDVPQTSEGPSRRRRRLVTIQSNGCFCSRQTFVDSDRKWRAYHILREKMQHETEKERLRLREIELQQQARWQELLAQFLLILEKISDKLNQDRDNQN